MASLPMRLLQRPTTADTLAPAHQEPVPRNAGEVEFIRKFMSDIPQIDSGPVQTTCVACARFAGNSRDNFILFQTDSSMENLFAPNQRSDSSSASRDTRLLNNCHPFGGSQLIRNFNREEEEEEEGVKVRKDRQESNIRGFT